MYLSTSKLRLDESVADKRMKIYHLVYCGAQTVSEQPDNDGLKMEVYSLFSRSHYTCTNASGRRICLCQN